MENVIEPLLPPDLGASSKSDSDIEAEVQQNPEEHTSDVWNNGDLTDALNRLIRVLHEGQETYRQAAERTKSDWLQGLLRGYSSQREQFVTELSNLAGGVGVMPDVGASVGEV